MNELELFSEQQKTMTVKEVAEILGTAESTIRNKVSELFPGITENGKATRLNELQVTELKRSIVPRDLTLKSKLSDVNTDIEMLQKSFEVMAWFKQKYDEQVKIIQEQNMIIAKKDEKIFLDAPKVESYEILMKTTDHRSISNACKHFGIQPIAIGFPYLRSHGYLTKSDLPTQKAINEDVLSLKENASKSCGKSFQQAVVLANQLEKFGKLIMKAVNK